MMEAVSVVVITMATQADAWDGQVWPTRPPTEREARDSGASLARAATMPWFPTHSVRCGSRACRPGEGNLKGYRHWAQPYLHREAYVQSRVRRAPHGPDARGYAGLVREAQRVAIDGLVVVAAADFDYRELVLNWVMHAHQLGYANSLVLSMDVELHADLVARNVPSFDNSALLDEWNATCLTRHIQRVRMERHLGLAALVSAGLDVLHTDATAVFVRGFVPELRAEAATHDADFLVQRDGGPAVAKLGCSVGAGFVYLRAKRRAAVVRFIHDVVTRGLVEFYLRHGRYLHAISQSRAAVDTSPRRLRWANNVDQFGYAFVAAHGVRDDKAAGSQLENQTTLLPLRRPGCGAGADRGADACLRMAFLPHDRFPRIGGWPDLRATAAIHHLMADGSLGDSFHNPPGVKPFVAHRQRLDRYDDTDFSAYTSVLREAGLWLVDASPDYRAPCRSGGVRERARPC